MSFLMDLADIWVATHHDKINKALPVTSHQSLITNNMKITFELNRKEIMEAIANKEFPNFLKIIENAAREYLREERDKLSASLALEQAKNTINYPAPHPDPIPTEVVKVEKAYCEICDVYYIPISKNQKFHTRVCAREIKKRQEAKTQPQDPIPPVTEEQNQRHRKSPLSSKERGGGEVSKAAVKVQTSEKPAKRPTSLKGKPAQKMERICKYCESTFIGHNVAKFCSDRCRNAYKSGVPFVPTVPTVPNVPESSEPKTQHAPIQDPVTSTSNLKPQTSNTQQLSWYQRKKLEQQQQKEDQQLLDSLKDHPKIDWKEVKKAKHHEHADAAI